MANRAESRKQSISSRKKKAEQQLDQGTQGSSRKLNSRSDKRKELEGHSGRVLG